jgi:uncharacterized protein
MVADSHQDVQPVSPAERILSLDVLRGLAVLGILIMNIQSFSMIAIAYRNPTAFGDFSGANQWIWILSHVLGDRKFMPIFAMLFGAGIILMSERVQLRGRSPAGVHYRRMFWLIVIGLLHAYALWYGDILFTYGLVALWVYLFRNRSPKTLTIIGLSLLLIPTMMLLFFQWSLSFWPPESITQLEHSWRPPLETVAKEVEAYRSGWLGQMPARASTAVFLQTFLFLIDTAWRTTGLMLIGMALYKWGILTAQRSRGFYLRMALVGIGLGLPLVILGVTENFQAGWVMQYSFFAGPVFNSWGGPLVSLGYIALVMLACLTPALSRLTRPFAAVGRLAFTNYLLQTLICTTIFYGHGLGLFGKVDRVGQVVIVAGVWIALLVFSSWYIRRFRYGPLEWLWRCLTYGSPQPFR